MSNERDQREDHLELEVDEGFHRAEWQWQRAGWVAWSLAVIAALLGLTGSGPLSHASATSTTGDLRVEYDRFERHHRQTSILVHVRHEPGGSPIRLKISQSLLDGMHIDRIEPEPAACEMANDGVIYSFPREAGAVSSKIMFHVQYEAFGKHSGQIGLVRNEPIALSQFIYP